MKGDFVRLRHWLDGGGNRTIELVLVSEKVQLVARVGGEPYTSGGGDTLEEPISWLEVKLFTDMPDSA